MQIKKTVFAINVFHNMAVLLLISSAVLFAFSLFHLTTSTEFALLSFSFGFPALILFLNAALLIAGSNKLFSTLLSVFLYIVFVIVTAISGFETHDYHYLVVFYYLFCWSILCVVSGYMDMLLMTSAKQIVEHMHKLSTARKKSPELFSDNEHRMLEKLCQETFRVPIYPTIKNALLPSYQCPGVNFYKRLSYFLRRDDRVELPQSKSMKEATQVKSDSNLMNSDGMIM